MSEKKSKDFVINIPSNGYNGGEKDPFSLDDSPPKPMPGYGSAPNSQPRNNQAIPIIAYCLSSISMTMVNKYVVSGGFWNLNFLYLGIQAIVSTTTITAAKQLGLVRSLSAFEIGQARRWFPISLLLVGMIYTGNKALQFLSVPVYTIFKNLTIIVIAYGEVLWSDGTVTSMSLLSFGLMVLSSVVAAWADVQSIIAGGHFTGDTSAAASNLSAGYAWMSINVCFSASYVLGMRRVIKKMKLKDWDTMYYNNLLSIPILTICSLLTEDWSRANFAKNFPEAVRTQMIIGMVYSGLAAIFISYCSVWCIRVTSSTTYSMVGALNKLPLSVAGLLFFDAPVTVASVSAILLGVISGVIYSWARIS